MRFSIMLQVVGLITLTLIVSAAMFARLQVRPNVPNDELDEQSSAEFRLVV